MSLPLPLPPRLPHRRCAAAVSATTSAEIPPRAPCIPEKQQAPPTAFLPPSRRSAVSRQHFYYSSLCAGEAPARGRSRGLILGEEGDRNREIYSREGRGRATVSISSRGRSLLLEGGRQELLLGGSRRLLLSRGPGTPRRPPLTRTMAISSNVGIALVLTCVGSFSTALGGVLVILQKVPDIKRLGLLQGFAAGLMLSLSFFDLIPNAIQAIGFAATNVWFFAGSLLFAGVVAFIPEPSLLPESSSASDVGSSSSRDRDSSQHLTGAPADSPSIHTPSSRGLVHRGLSPSLPGDRNKGLAKDKVDGPGSTGAAPADDSEKEGERETTRRRRKAVLYSGIITAVGISMHNFPEGIAVFLGSMKGLRVGISLAVAIALHNIPEGLAVALPIYYATRNRWVAFRAAALSGLAEPLAVIVVGLLFPTNLAPELIEGMLAGVGGIMAFLTLHEMLPLAFEYAGHKTAVTSAFVGMAVMSANLQLLAMVVPPDVAL